MQCRFQSFAKFSQQQVRNASSVKILKNTYKDSIELMQLSNKLKGRKGVKDAAVMLGTDANVELMRNAGLMGNESCTLSDIIISCVAEDDAAVNDTLKFAVDSLTAVADSFGSGGGTQQAMKPKTIEEGIQSMKGANFIIISSPGNYATAETMKALKKGLHVFLFSDNVSVEDELMLKTQAAKKKLLLMGPDCGTAILDGIPFGFANAVRRGTIGMIASSGTGAQQVSCLVDKFGQGCSQLIGTGGRDLKEKVGGIMTLLSIDVLEADPKTQVITIISKGQPGPSVMKALCARVSKCKKPVVAVLLGADGTELTKVGAHVAFTLEDAAKLSVQVLEGRDKPSVPVDPNSAPREKTDAYGLKPQQTKVVGLFAGGTHSAETTMVLKKMQADHKEFANVQMDVIDLGDDEYCVGKPHPMIDGTTRKSVFIKRASEPDTAVIIFDVVLGFGSHENPAADICEAIATCRKNNPNVIFVGHVCGVSGDFQGLDQSEKLLRDHGVILLPTNAQASRVAGQIAARMQPVLPAGDDGSFSSIFGSISALNLGLAHFTTGVTKYGGKAIQLDWKPPAKGNRDAGLQLASLFGDATDPSNIGNLVDKANEEAVNRLKAGTPFLLDVKLAKDVIPGFTGKKICHSGPPITWDRMCGPMRGAIIGATIYEGWAKDLESAEKLAASGAIEFAPCHHYNAVGPMSGILSPNFPVAIVENTAFKNKAYSSMNEGLGKVLRMGANSEAVLQKLAWIRDVLAPTLSEALKVSGPIDLRAITQQALMMGDECHNRNAAATSIFTRALAPSLLKSDPQRAGEVLEFLKSNDHFYLNLSMAACKATLDGAKNIKGSTICVAMSRNGVDFGVRLSGTGDQWFVAPAEQIKGLYFPGYTEADANPDIGDSSITETIGIGGFAMACAPAIVKFVGGNAQDAIANTREMYRITQTKNAMNAIPVLDFEGTPLGIDARKVADSLIQPVINTGIAHKIAGVGQVGAGIALAPLQPFISGIQAVYSDLTGGAQNKNRE